MRVNIVSIQPIADHVNNPGIKLIKVVDWGIITYRELVIVLLIVNYCRDW